MTNARLQHTGKLSAVSPFDLRQSLRALAGFAPCGGEQRIADGTVRKALLTGMAFLTSATKAAPAAGEKAAAGDGAPGDSAPGEAAVVEVGPRGDGRVGVSLAVYAHRALDDATLRGVQRSVSDWLGLSDDMAGFLAVAADDPALAPVLAQVVGLHQVRFASLAEGACYFVLTQRTAQRVAGLRKRRLADAYGPSCEVDGERYVAFPGLARLVRLSADEIGRFTANTRQTDYLIALVRALIEWDDDWLRTAPYDEVYAELRRIRGVGEFTATAIMLRVLGRPDRLPLHMPQFSAVAARLYGADTPIDAVAERYGRYLGWWAYYARTAIGLASAPHTTRAA